MTGQESGLGWTIERSIQDLSGILCEGSEDILEADGLFGQIKKAVAERALAAELGYHLRDEAAGDPPARNHRNGSSAKTVQTDTGALTLAIGPGPSSRSWCRNTSAGWPASTTR